MNLSTTSFGASVSRLQFIRLEALWPMEHDKVMHSLMAPLTSIEISQMRYGGVTNPRWNEFTVDIDDIVSENGVFLLHPGVVYGHLRKQKEKMQEHLTEDEVFGIMNAAFDCMQENVWLKVGM